MKALVLLVFLGVIIGSIFAGWTLVVGPIMFSFLGLVLLGRWVIQVIRSRIHLWRTRVLYLPLLQAIHELHPDIFSANDIQKWYKKRLNAEMWMIALLNEYPILQDQDAWRAVVDESFRQIPLEQWRAAFPDQNLKGDPAVFVKKLLVAGVPVYGIQPNEMQETLDKMVQYPPFWKVAVVLNDPPKEGDSAEISKNKQEIRTFFKNWFDKAQGGDTQWIFVDLDVANKKKAMAAAVRQFTRTTTNAQGETIKKAKAPIFINVDADTNANPFANFFTILAFVMFPKLNGLTSNVRIKNVKHGKNQESANQNNGTNATPAEKTTWFERVMLPLLTYFRYDAVNNVERAARWWNETVLSGPWLAVRLGVFIGFLDVWLDFKFAGKEVRPGDDRRITFELNRLKLATAYFAQVIVYTDCPETMKRWKSQQSRWTLSYYVNMWDSFVSGQYRKLTMWSLFDQVYGGFFSFFLLGAISSVVVQAIRLLQAGNSAGWDIFIFYGTMIFLANFARGAYAAITNRDIKGFVMTFYVYLFVRYLMPIKITRLFNLTDQRWQGRHGVS